MVFTELSCVLAGARPLHGDIQQSFVNHLGTFFQINYISQFFFVFAEITILPLQCEPLRDVEDYIHRSGRTRRAGNSGVAITLYKPRNSNISKLEREVGVKFEHISAPQPAILLKLVVKNSGLTPVELLAKALAKSIVSLYIFCILKFDFIFFPYFITGYTEIKHMSLLSYMENHVTLHLEAGIPVYTPL
uniref:Helicase C-terminal domain-containing protein n=1 Tax=Lactuca sativa TaxID=4236 RepID=A0A9R1UV31_LACSA|nr:hypothetical protein LSAT_V11C800452620 [Lactuca sativa]